MSDSDATTTPPDANEPRTPMWLPALGAALFVAVGLIWAISSSEPPSTGAAPPVAPDAGAGSVRN